MARSHRLFDIMTTLRDGKQHRAQDLAAHLGVSVRTIYRDMETLIASGIPIEGARGVGYTFRDVVPLPPITLTRDEVEALNLGIAIVSEATDPDLKRAALTLADKIDAVLPTQAVAEEDAWKFTASPFADAARGFSHMPTLRAAIKTRQKLTLSYHDPGGGQTDHTIRPLHLEYWGRIWTLTAWCDRAGDFHVFRVDLIETVVANPELFTDEPGKTLADYQNRPAR